LAYRTLQSVEVWADSGLPDDIQLAITQISATGGTVYIPSSITQPDGKWYWHGETVTIPSGGVNLIGASMAGCSGHESNWASYTATTILHNIHIPNKPMFIVGHDTHGQTTNEASRFSGIQFESDGPVDRADEDTGGNTCVVMHQIPNFRIDHCTFVNFTSTAIALSDNCGWGHVNVSCYGVVDHNVITNPYKLTPPPDAVARWYWAYGIIVGGGMRADSEGILTEWDENVSDWFGYYGHKSSSTIAYIEDNHISLCRHPVASNAGAFYTARYNLIDKPACGYTAASMDVHGAAYPAGRGMIAYGNTIVGAPENVQPWNPANPYYSVAVGLRGGSSLVYDNTFICDNNPNNKFLLLSTGDNKVGLEYMAVSKTYIWGNTVTGAAFSGVDTGITLNVDYFTREPTQAQDGFTYTPYSYPHPLTLEGEPPPPPQNTTPFSEQLDEGVYEISVPSIVTDTSGTYNFKQWNDGDTNPTKSVNLNTNVTLTAVYELVPPEIKTATLKGFVKDTAGAPIADANVKCDGLTMQTLPDGSYEFTNLELKQYTVTISKQDYESKTLQVDASAGGTINLPETKLSTTPIPRIVFPRVRTILSSLPRIARVYVRVDEIRLKRAEGN
jgi:hypothetical protein